jgi:hypothetical protein
MSALSLARFVAHIHNAKANPGLPVHLHLGLDLGMEVGNLTKLGS